MLGTDIVLAEYLRNASLESQQQLVGLAQPGAAGLSCALQTPHQPGPGLGLPGILTPDVSTSTRNMVTSYGCFIVRRINNQISAQSSYPQLNIECNGFHQN